VGDHGEPAPRILLPDGFAGGLDQLFEELPFAAPATGRPTVIANFVSSVDGSTSIGGGSTELSGRAPGDQPLFHQLRERVDGVLAGTTTIEHEGYRRLVRDPAARARRVDRGLAADPTAVVLSRSGRVPWDGPLLREEAQPRAVFTGEDAEPVRALRRLRADHGIDLLLCEGGPTLFTALLHAGLVDELLITFSPVLRGGAPERTLLGGAGGAPVALELVWLLEQSGGLHARYRVLPDSVTPG